MAENMSGMTRHDAERRLIERAARDHDFRRNLISDPKRAVFDELGFEIPPGYDVRVLEEDASTMYLVLPANAAGEGELSDLELEAVAGGKGGTTVKCGVNIGSSTQQMPSTSSTDCQ